MGPVEIIGIVLSLITTFGPKALDIYEEWQAGIGPNPTPEEMDKKWAELKARIDSHDPDTY